MIKLIVLDVDGVLTKGDITFDNNGNELKTFNVKDGLGISLAKKANIKLAIITGRSSVAVTTRANELKIDFVYQGIHSKCDVLDELIKKLDIAPGQVAYMGDDLNDLSIIKKVGFSGAPLNGVSQVKETVNFISKYNGGDGAVREFIEAILLNENNISDLVSLFESQSSYVQ